VCVLLVTNAELDVLDQALRQLLVEWLPSTHDGADTEHGAHALFDVDQEVKHEHDRVLPVTNVEPLALDQVPRHDRAVPLLSMEYGKHLEHGVRAPCDVDPELKHEHDRAVTPTAVDDLVKDHPLKHDHAELLSSTPDGELSEDGVHAPHNVDWEHRHEHVHVSPVTRVELHVLEHRVNHDRAVKPSSTHDGEHTENGASVQLLVVWELKHDHEPVLLEILAVMLVLVQLLRQDRAEKPSYMPNGEHSEHGAHARLNVEPVNKHDHDLASRLILAVMIALDRPERRELASSILS